MEMATDLPFVGNFFPISEISANFVVSLDGLRHRAPALKGCLSLQAYSRFGRAESSYKADLL